jgi:hypothetical protein
MKYAVLIFGTVVLLGCSREKALERRSTARERRVASLEQQTTVKPTNTSLGSPAVSASEAGTGQSSALKPKFQFLESEFDFGTIQEGEVVEHLFQFTNVGNAPLIIKKASASCGCTVPSTPKDPILPGESSEIKVRFDSRNKPNQQLKTITIEANTEPVMTRLQIKGFVVPNSQ